MQLCPWHCPGHVVPSWIERLRTPPQGLHTLLERRRLTPRPWTAPADPSKDRDALCPPPWLKPRLVFDGLTRTAFDACAELCNEVLDRRMRNLPETERPVVRCAVRTDGPGSYLLSFEIPHDEPAALAPERKPKCWGKGRRRPHQPAGSPEPALQLELLSATRIVGEMIPAVSLICATASGHHRQWIPAGLRERGGAGDP